MKDGNSLHIDRYALFGEAWLSPWRLHKPSPWQCLIGQLIDLWLYKVYILLFWRFCFWSPSFQFHSLSWMAIPVSQKCIFMSIHSQPDQQLAVKGEEKKRIFFFFFTKSASVTAPKKKESGKSDLFRLSQYPFQQSDRESREEKKCIFQLFHCPQLEWSNSAKANGKWPDKDPPPVFVKTT